MLNNERGGENRVEDHLSAELIALKWPYHRHKSTYWIKSPIKSARAFFKEKGGGEKNSKIQMEITRPKEFWTQTRMVQLSYAQLQIFPQMYTE